MNVKAEIFKDTSGKTFGYKIIKDGEEWLFSDGFKTEKEIEKELKEYKEVFANLQI